MKKIFALLLIATISLSCSSSDDSSSSGIYNPPSWIHGTWGFEETEFSAENAIYKFTSDNVCQLSQGISSFCWKEVVQQSPNVMSGSDSSTSTTYEANLTGGGQTTTLTFEKISATQIKWTNTSGGDFILFKLQ